MQLIEKTITINNKSARYYQCATQTAHQSQQENKKIDEQSYDEKLVKMPAHFYGGNGFVTGVYQPLLAELSQAFDISSLAMRGYWYDKPDVQHTEKVLTREADADMLIEFLKATQSDPVVGIGHSQGATATAIAAAKCPKLFHSVYLIEPVTFTKQQKMLYDLLPRFIKAKNEPFTSTLKKQTHWQSVDDYYQYLRSHKAYKRVSDEHLYIYANSSLEKTKDGEFELLFAPEQELASYFGIPYIDKALKSLQKQGVPFHIFTGKPSLFISDKVRKCWKEFLLPTQMTVMQEYGHLLPIEAPKEVAMRIMQKV